MKILKRLLVFLLIVIILAILSYYWPQVTGNIPLEQTSYEKETAFVIRVIDGDTIDTDKGKIRLLGINTPEKTNPYYKEAKDYLKNIENKSIEIQRDKTDLDKYDRKLRYIFYENQLINVDILQQGLATSFMTEDLVYKEKLINAEKFAKENEIGLWKKSNEKCAECIKLTKLEFNPPEYFVIKNECNLFCNLTGWFVKDDANHFFYLNDLPAGEEKAYSSETEIWNDDGDRFFMRDENGGLIMFYEY